MMAFVPQARTIDLQEPLFLLHILGYVYLVDSVAEAELFEQAIDFLAVWGARCVTEILNFWPPYGVCLGDIP